MRSGFGGSTPEALRVALTLAIASILAMGIPGGAAGQTTNRAVFEEIGVACLADLPQSDELHVMASDSLPYLRAALTEAWRNRGVRISLDDADLPTLRYRVRHADISYERVGRSRFRRDASLAIDYTLTDTSGTVIKDGVCSDTRSDTVRARDVASLEDPAFSETVGEVPRAGWVRRYLEPAVLVGAAAVGVFLFFSLRSGGGA